MLPVFASHRLAVVPDVSDTGGASDSTVQTLHLPMSGLRLQWRSDGFFREVLAGQWAQEESGEWIPAREEWVAATGPSYQMRMERRPGDPPEPTWILLYGERAAEAMVSVRLADGSTPRVHVLGQVWGCEWIGLYQQATVSVGGEDWTTPPIERVAQRRPFIGPTQGWLHPKSPPWLDEPARPPGQLPQ